MNTNSIILSQASGQYLQALDSASLEITGNITIEAWIKPTAVTGTMGLLDKGDGPTIQNYQIILSLTSFQLYVSTTGSDLVAIGAGQGPSGLIAGAWNHIAVTWTPGSPGSYAYYLNGSLVASGTQTLGNTTSNGSQLKIGWNVSGPGGTPYYFDGGIDELRIWNSIRSASDISNNYQRELAGNESGLVLYAKLNNNYNDATANANNLTPSGIPTFTTDVPFSDNTTTSTSTTSTSSSTTTTSTSTSTTTTSTSTSSSTSRTTSSSTTLTNTTTSTSTTTTSTSTTTTSTSTTSTSTTSTSSTTTLDFRIIVEKIK